MKISLVINCDTRSGFDALESQFGGVNMSGCKSSDFLTHGVINKVNFFSGLDLHETIIFIDEHKPVPNSVMEAARNLCDTVVVRKHSKFFRGGEFQHFNDLNYLSALQIARGDIVCHMDQDTTVFSNGPNHVQKMIDGLEEWKFISYPSPWTPRAVTDPSFGKRTWASTRFFLCKRETLRFDELQKCIVDPDWAYATFGDSPRRCNWLEHFMSLTNGDSVFYPPVDYENMLVFCWSKYIQGVLPKMNQMSFKQAYEYVRACGGIHYPNDVDAI